MSLLLRRAEVFVKSPSHAQKPTTAERWHHSNGSSIHGPRPVPSERVPFLFFPSTETFLCRGLCQVALSSRPLTWSMYYNFVS